MKIARTNRLLAGAAALAVVLTLSACGSDDNTASTTSHERRHVSRLGRRILGGLGDR